MNAVIGSAELELFQSAIVRRLGLRFDDNRLTFLAEVLTRRIAARKLSAGAYIAALVTELEASDELSALARELTVGETYFFRHVEQFHAFRDVALPERLSARAASRSLRLLSAGCASGEEPYSLAILLRERGLEPGYEATVQGLDLNPDSLAKAATGLYSPWSLRETPNELRDRWFQKEGRDFRLVRAVRDGVRFAQHNLILDAPQLAPGSLDVVFCRNVLMYFTPQQAASVVERLARALAPGGFLFLGHAETLRGLSHSFHLRHTHNTFYYQRRDGADARSTIDLLPSFALSGADAPATQAPEDWVAPWLETVARTSQRIRELNDEDTPATEPTAEPITRKNAPLPGLRQPLALLGHDRFAEALEALHQLSPSERVDPAALLLRAALLTHQGDLSESEKTCHELLRSDDLNAGAHYLLALCQERRGHAPAAVEHDLTAAYLDPDFAMPHLHLGLMARRRRDAAVARHELGQALNLLEREDASRLLLFGGGFSRAALLSLCRSELANLKALP